MRISRADLADFAYFIALAKHRSFRRAGLELGVTASALSHSLKGLETRIGVRLINRTSRSVTLTAAGEDFHAALTGPFDAIGTAVEGLNRYRDDPAGRINLNVMEQASSLLLAPVLPVFVERYPGIAVDVAITNHLVDVVGRRHPAHAPRRSEHLSLGVREGRRGDRNRCAGCDHARPDPVRLCPVLEEWASMGPGFHIYYPERQQLPTGHRLLIDLIRELQPLGL
jgi:DNA-binding transcriptional LysR family regulator